MQLRRKWWRAAAATKLALALCSGVAAQGGPPQLAGRTLQGQPVSLQALRGKVVLVFVWSTRCPVCLDQMPELRRNLAGWRGRDFVVVALGQDRTEADVRAYERALAAAGAPPGPQLQLLWRSDQGHRDSFGDVPLQSPATFVIDRDGRLRHEARGRWDPELWNEVAELVLN